MTDEELMEIMIEAQNSFEPVKPDVEMLRETVEKIMSDKLVYDSMKKLSEM